MFNSLNILSYNILNPFHAVKHKESNGVKTTSDSKVMSNWESRAPFLVNNLIASNFHLASLQEVSAIQAQHLRKYFSLIAPAYPENDIDGRTFANCLAYQPSILRLEYFIESIFHAGEEKCLTPGIIAAFKHLPSQKVLIVVSIHLKGYDLSIKDDNELRLAKQTGYNQLKRHLFDAKELMKRLGCKTILVAGDFNEDTHSIAPPNRMRLMKEEGFSHDGYLSVTEPAKNRKIDWIYAAGALLSPNPLNCPHPEASDHLPLVSRLQL